MILSIPRSAHTVMRPGMKRNLSQYPATAKYEQREAPCLHDQPWALPGQCASAPRLRVYAQHLHRLMPDPETRSDHFTIINKQFIKIKTSWIKTHPEPFRIKASFSPFCRQFKYICSFFGFIKLNAEHDCWDSWVIVNPSRSDLRSVIIMLSHWKENFIRVDSRRKSVHFAPDITIWIWHPHI